MVLCPVCGGCARALFVVVCCLCVVDWFALEFARRRCVLRVVLVEVWLLFFCWCVVRACLLLLLVWCYAMLECVGVCSLFVVVCWSCVVVVPCCCCALLLGLCCCWLVCFELSCM